MAYTQPGTPMHRCSKTGLEKLLAQAA